MNGNEELEDEMFDVKKREDGVTEERNGRSEDGSEGTGAEEAFCRGEEEKWEADVEENGINNEEEEEEEPNKGESEKEEGAKAELQPCGRGNRAN